jgi:drug/metabolite transporter (DMT)-like permease
MIKSFNSIPFYARVKGSLMGSLAAILTSICWSWSSIFFSSAGYTVGSKVVNRTRLLFAVTFLIIAHTLIAGSPIPLHVEGYRWLWLGLSAIFGLVLGDAMLFQSYVLIGPRLAMLVMASSPAISAVFAWLFLGEMLGIFQVLGILLTSAGIMLVVLDQSGDQKSPLPVKNKKRIMGLLLSLGGSFGQATGIIFAKKGLVGDFSPLTGVLIRMLVAAAAIWLLALFTKEVKLNFQLLKQHPKSARSIFFGAFVGPFIGVWLSLIAVQNTKVGITSTLIALTPIFHLPIARFYLHEKISARAILGTFIAMAGIAVIFLVP